MAVGVYFYHQLAGVYPKWILAVYAVSQSDADNRVRVVWHGGKRAGIADPRGIVKADCGDITDAAQREISDKHESWLNGP